MLPAMVLAAGLGTRLRPLTNWCAKSLVPVGDRPALSHALDRLNAAGVTRIAVNAHHRADDVRAFSRACGTMIAVSEEEELLGTAGGLARAGALLGEGDALVWNADIVADVDLHALVASRANGNAEAALVVQAGVRGRGSIGIDDLERIVRLREERFGDEVCGGEFLGISVVSAALRGRLPERGCLVGDVWLPALRAGATVRALIHRGPWQDIGTLGGYLAANLTWLDARKLRHWAGDGAQIEAGVSLDRAILGAGAVVQGPGALARCVVWPGARANAPQEDAVVTARGVVRVALGRGT